MKNTIKKEFQEFALLLRNVPAVITAVFILSVFSMNLLANKSINLPVDWLALDCGVIVSWFAFLSMDVLTKRFGPKASTCISLLAVALNLFMCLLFFIGSKIPGTWGESYVEGSEQVINGALDNTFGGTWYVLFGSTVAFVASALINNFSNLGIGKLFGKHPDGAAAFYVRSLVSTALSQFADNLIFALIVSHFFFGWSIVQCLTCAATGMLFELVCEGAFTPVGLAVCRRWEKLGVGKEYLDFIAAKKEKV